MSGNGSSNKNVLKTDKRIELYEYLKGQKEDIERHQIRPEIVAKDARICLGFNVTQYNVLNLTSATGIRWAHMRTKPAPAFYGDADFETVVHALGHLYQDRLDAVLPGPFKNLINRVMGSQRTEPPSELFAPGAAAVEG